MSFRSYEFTHAITRRPAASATHGLRAVDTGAPDIALMLDQHAHYVAALRAEGATVIELAPLMAFPDAQCVEAVARCGVPRLLCRDRAGGVGGAVFAVGAGAQDGDARHPGVAEFRHQRQHELLIPSAFPRRCAKRHRCLATDENARG